MRYTHLVFFLIVSLIFSSCTKDEDLNSEADIIEIIVPAEILKTNPTIENSRITIRVKANTNLIAQAPEFTLSAGATISPESGTTLNFTQPRLYTVTSEDEKYSKEYTISYIAAEVPLNSDFSHYRLSDNGKYHVLYETDDNGDNIMDWTSGNAGFSITAGNTPASQYPTSYTDFENGFAAKLTTLSTGVLGESYNKPIAAGNIFMGTFDASSVLSNPLRAVKMGIPFERTPEKLIVSMKYSQGETFVQVVENEQGQMIVEKFANSEKLDQWDIYAIFYDNNGGTLMLDGTNKFTHENLISIAHIAPEEAVETDVWTQHEIPFVPINGKTIDPQKLAVGGYNISVIMSSSVGGDFFRGAINSTLLIDNLKIVCTE